MLSRQLGWAAACVALAFLSFNIGVRRLKAQGG